MTLKSLNSTFNMSMIALIVILMLFFVSGADSVSVGVVRTVASVCKYNDFTCSDAGIDYIENIDLSSVRPIQWVVATNLYCNKLSPQNCSAAPMCAVDVHSYYGYQCKLKNEMRTIALSCAGSAIRQFALCSLNKIASDCSKASSKGCTWSIETNVCTFNNANPDLVAIRQAWACPSLVGCCPASNELYNDSVKCSAVNMAQIFLAASGTPDKTDWNKTCTNIGCYYTASKACTSKPHYTECSTHHDEKSCLNQTRPVPVSMSTLAKIASISPITFSVGSSRCSKERMRPDFLLGAKKSVCE